MGSIVKDRYLAGRMDKSTAEKYLKQYAGMDADYMYFYMQKLDYQKRTGESTSSDYVDIYAAIDAKESPKAAINAAMQHGKEAKSIASGITSRYKETYLELLQTNKSEAAAMKGRLITVFDFLGYDGAKKVADWSK